MNLSGGLLINKTRYEHAAYHSRYERFQACFDMTTRPIETGFSNEQYRVKVGFHDSRE